jgi:hypothetical protein
MVFDLQHALLMFFCNLTLHALVESKTIEQGERLLNAYFGTLKDHWEEVSRERLKEIDKTI